VSAVRTMLEWPSMSWTTFKSAPRVRVRRQGLEPRTRGLRGGVPGHPSKHGANIDANWSRPLWPRTSETRPGKAAGIAGKGIGARPGATCYL